MRALKIDQVVFPAAQVASADPNTLDDYEEGNWTPVLGGELGTATGQVYTVQQGRYTKVGRLIIASFEIQLVNKGTMTGNYAAITGLPFTSGGGINQSGTIGYATGFASALSDIGLYLPPNGQVIYLTGAAADSTNPKDSLLKAVIGNATAIMGTVIYVV